MSGDPAIASIEQLVHGWRLRKRSKGPGPPDLAGEKNHGIRTTDTAAVSSQKAHLFQRRAGLEMSGMTGMTYNPLTRIYRLTPDASVNYIAAFRKSP